jgi:hypothetical protein
MINAGRAKIYFFKIKRENGWFCSNCCDYFYSSDPYCFTCMQDAKPYIKIDNWYLIDCDGKYKFHQPYMPKKFTKMAKPIPEHEPTQPQRKIPKIGLTIEAQKICVKMATKRLSKMKK